MYRQSEKNLLSSNTSSTCPDNMVNFGPLYGWDPFGSLGTPTNFNGFCVWQRYCTASSSGRQPNFAALNRGRHLCSAGQPSGWAFAHILVIHILYNRTWFISQFCSAMSSSPRWLSGWSTPLPRERRWFKSRLHHFPLMLNPNPTNQKNEKI